MAADIAPARQYGTTLAPWGASEIRMTGEVVRIRLEKEQAIFDVTFQLENAGDEAVSLDVGFPDAVQVGSWSTDVRTHPSQPFPRLRNFEVLVDGEAASAEPRFFQRDADPLLRTEVAESYRRRERAIAAEGDPEKKARLQAALEQDREFFGWWNSQGWLAWPMTFDARQRRTVTVRYDLPYRGPYRHELLGFKAVEYVLKSGAFWDGPIGRVVIEIELGEGITHGHVKQLGLPGSTRTEQGFRWELQDLEPTQDVELVLTDYVDAADALRGYSELAKAQSGEDAEKKAAWYRCTAWEVAQQLEPSGLEIELVQKILTYERKVLPAREGAWHGHPRIRYDIRAPYVPWEWRLVQSLERNGRTEEARRAARKALPVLTWWLGDERGRDWNWGRVPVEMLKSAIAHCETLIAAGG